MFSESDFTYCARFRVLFGFVLDIGFSTLYLYAFVAISCSSLLRKWVMLSML